MSFTAERRPSGDSPSLPFCVRFNEPLRRRRQHYGFTSPYRHAATLDTEPLAKSYPGGNRTRLSSNHFRAARAPRCYATASWSPGRRDQLQVPSSCVELVLWLDTIEYLKRNQRTSE
jgi:hypothetical protein